MGKLWPATSNKSQSKGCTSGKFLELSKGFATPWKCISVPDESFISIEMILIACVDVVLFRNSEDLFNLCTYRNSFDIRNSKHAYRANENGSIPMGRRRSLKLENCFDFFFPAMQNDLFAWKMFFSPIGEKKKMKQKYKLFVGFGYRVTSKIFVV